MELNNLISLIFWYICQTASECCRHLKWQVNTCVWILYFQNYYINVVFDKFLLCLHTCLFYQRCCLLFGVPPSAGGTVCCCGPVCNYPFIFSEISVFYIWKIYLTGNSWQTSKLQIKWVSGPLFGQKMIILHPGHQPYTKISQNIPNKCVVCERRAAAVSIAALAMKVSLAIWPC